MIYYLDKEIILRTPNTDKVTGLCPDAAHDAHFVRSGQDRVTQPPLIAGP